MRMFRWALPMAVAASLLGAPVHADDFGEVLVVTHLDIIPTPTFMTDAVPLIEKFVHDSRKDPGVISFTMITWDPTTNHFQLIERFRNMRAFDAHVSAKHTVDFRNALQPFIGAPYDERLYTSNP
jgi:quinol monooxygenase YgiN